MVFLVLSSCKIDKNTTRTLLCAEDGLLEHIIKKIMPMNSSSRKIIPLNQVSPSWEILI